MKNIKLIAILLLSIQNLSAQKSLQKVANEYAAIDKKALQIPDSLAGTTEGIANYITSNFSTDKEMVRAIFIWVATNIQYDIDNMFAINFYEKKEDKIAKALKTRKGICSNYAELFNDICLKAGLISIVIEGYTKQNGFADYIPHAWCAAYIDNAWFLFDPTWGSGYISNNKCYKKINDNYFKALPSTLIKSHMPFDYLWQFLNYPITNQEFYEGKTLINKSKPFLNYIDSIELYDKQNRIDQLLVTAKRVEQNGVKNSLIFDRLQHLKLEIENYRNNLSVNSYNTAAINYNEAIAVFNQFIDYRNKRFIPEKTDAEIQKMIGQANHKLSEAKANLKGLNNTDPNISTMIIQLNKLIDDAIPRVKEQQDWLQVYFSKGKSGRKSMFNEKRITLFGIPL